MKTAPLRSKLVSEQSMVPPPRFREVCPELRHLCGQQVRSFFRYGRRDLIHSALDALASTANYLKSYGWTSNQPWTEGSPNFRVLQKWNDSEVYAKTVAYFAMRLGKEP
jgi:Transglycosylase SLT domain